MPDRHAWQDAVAARRPHLRTTAANRLVLLGTSGGSMPKATACGYANAVVVGDAAYLVDAGEGMHRQMWRAGLTANARSAADRPLVRAIALTHLHADHLMDLPNLLQGSWPTTPIDVYGPGPAGPPYTTHDDPVHPVRFPESPAPGIREVLDHFHRAFAVNINARIVGERRHDFLDLITVHEIGLAGEGAGAAPTDIAVDAVVDRGGPVFDVPPVEPFVVQPEDDCGVTITATLVQHAPIFPALAYRFDTPTGSVVFSGDTGPCDNVVRLAQGADLLVHEVFDIDVWEARMSSHLAHRDHVVAQMRRAHTAVDAVGDIAERAGVGTLVLSHLVPSDGGHSTDEWEARIQPDFPSGKVVCGVDLDEFPIGPEGGTSHG
jgi:ribonuclease BN (tRNA processing enzyme)